MDADDLAFCRDYFRSERRDPTLTEIRMIDTYWSDHCRHTTFLTTLDSVKAEKPAVEKAFARYLAMWALAIVRVALCLPAQNEWLAYRQPLGFGIWRNIPFAIMSTASANRHHCGLPENQPKTSAAVTVNVPDRRSHSTDRPKNTP